MDREVSLYYAYVTMCFMCVCVCLNLDQEPQTEVAAQLAQEFYNFDLPLHLVNNLAKLDFEVSTNNDTIHCTESYPQISYMSFQLYPFLSLSKVHVHVCVPFVNVHVPSLNVHVPSLNVPSLVSLHVPSHPHFHCSHSSN